MKVMLYVVLDHVAETEQLLRDLSKKGYNGTVIPTTGLHHVLPKFSDGSGAISLAMMVDDLPEGNITLFMIMDEETVEAVKKDIREATHDFTYVKGGMFVLPLLSWEGSFESK